MLIRPATDIRSSEITPYRLYMRRREFLGAMVGLAGFGDTLAPATRVVTTTDTPTPQQVVTSYNNFYEFGSDKSGPARNAAAFKPKPWSVAVEGLCGKPGIYALEDFLKPHPIEERVYRMRCVEGWSMVIPWDGFSLSKLLDAVQPTGDAKFVAFETLHDPKRMPNQNSGVLPWPYVEGLRMDEAMNPLTFL